LYDERLLQRNAEATAYVILVLNTQYSLVNIVYALSTAERPVPSSLSARLLRFFGIRVRFRDEFLGADGSNWEGLAAARTDLMTETRR
jgi:hypothetical protein